MIKTPVLALCLAFSMFCVAAADTLADQKRMAAKSLEFWSNGDVSQLDAVFAPSYSNHQNPEVDGRDLTVDLEQWSKIIQGYHAAFPNTQIKILDQVAEDDQVSTRWEFTGTQTGTYLGLAPTSKTISWTGMQIDRFEDGKIAETWVNWDMYSMFKQLGLLKD
ncbi:MAG: ester cyclase [Pseudomonadota bacterium]